MQDKYLIHLSGQGDAEIFLVNKPVWNWVINGEEFPPGFEKDYNKINFPEKLSEEYVSMELENDRASLLYCCSVEYADKHYISFDCIKDLIDYCAKLNINIVDTFEGYIY